MTNTEICVTCEGTGIFYGSNCCGVLPKGNGDSDSSDLGICPECGEHCEYESECEECNGTGQVKL